MGRSRAVELFIGDSSALPTGRGSKPRPVPCGGFRIIGNFGWQHGVYLVDQTTDVRLVLLQVWSSDGMALSLPTTKSPAGSSRRVTVRSDGAHGLAEGIRRQVGSELGNPSSGSELCNDLP